MEIALIGYGKMGRTIEKAAIARGHKVIVTIDDESQWQQSTDKLATCDVAIEFSTPEAAPENIRRCFEAGIPVVCGTTGWLNELANITRLCNQQDQSLFWASNFSIGVNFFFKLNRQLADMLSDMHGYRPRIIETHHTEKMDAPSGTAITLANEIIAARRALSKWGDASKDLTDDTLPIKSYRIENITGTHVVTYESMIDNIEIKHTAHNRSGFAEGALIAAEWLQNKKGVFSMQDLLNI
jgi:4-hydroxy-tetrahydrodipicolinate reductase